MEEQITIEQFADHPTSQMVKELGFNERCYEYGSEGLFGYPSWWQIKQFLWEKYKFTVCVDINRDKECHCCVRDYNMEIIIPSDILSENWKPKFFDSPIEAERDAIRKAVKHLHEQLNRNI